MDNANATILNLLNNGHSSIDLLRIIANYHRYLREQDLHTKLDGIVVDGPFKGLKHPGHAFGSVLAPKLLGSYEKEIQVDLMRLSKQSDCFLDIGCAEGFYTAGIAFSTEVKTVIGVDINESALNLAKEFAKSNNISAKCRFTKDLKEALTLLYGKTLIMIDVDGAEIELIDQLFNDRHNKIINKSTIIIETDKAQGGRSNREEIVARLKDYGFGVEKEIKQSIYDRFSETGEELSISFLDQCVLSMEGRPFFQSWLIAKAFT